MTSAPQPDVAVFIPSYVGGGAERLAFFIAEALTAAGYRVDLVIARAHGELKEKPLSGVRKINLDAVTEILAAPLWIGYLRRERPRMALAMVHTATLTAGIGKRLAPSVPVVIAVQNALKRAAENRWWFQRIFGFGLEKSLYARCEKMIAVSDGLARECEAVFGLPSRSVDHLYNPYLSDAAPGLPEKMAIDPDHERIFSKPVILGVGRLAPQKGFSVLISAFAQIAPTHDANLLILGEGPERSALEQQAADAGLGDRVFLPGWTPTPASYMRRSRLFVLSSIFEGFGIVCVEALASGVSMVVADCPHGPREIVDGGRFARLAVPGDAQSLAGAIRAELDETDQGGANGLDDERRAWLEQFSPEAAAARYRELVRSVIGPPAAQ